MKTAVVYDSLIEKGGSERATLVLARVFNADVWTTDYNPSSTYSEYRHHKIISNPIICRKIKIEMGRLNFLKRGWIKMESIYRFQRANLKEYDLVISIGDYSKHIPVYEHKRLHYELYVKNNYGNYPLDWLFNAWVDYMRRIDNEAIQKIPVLACNSVNIKNKIQFTYKRNAEVVYPAVNISMFQQSVSENYFLAVERITPEKGIETQIRAFRELPDQNLIIVGSPNNINKSYYENLKRLAPINVLFLGSVTDGELVDLYSHSLGAIQTNPDEDLGRVPIESMASGKPCIGVNAGGFRETILNGKTGILVNQPYSENLVEAIKHFNKLDFNPQDCLDRAKLFSEEAHIEKMRTIVANL